MLFYRCVKKREGRLDSETGELQEQPALRPRDRKVRLYIMCLLARGRIVMIGRGVGMNILKSLLSGNI